MSKILAARAGGKAPSTKMALYPGYTPIVPWWTAQPWRPPGRSPDPNAPRMPPQQREVDTRWEQLEAFKFDEEKDKK